MAQKLSRVTRDIWALSLATFINRATGFLGLFAAVFFNEIKLDAQAVVLALLIVGIAGVSGSLVGGHLADRIGKLPVLLGSTLINIVIFTALALADYTLGWWTVTLAALNVFVSQSFVGPASALVAASASGRERVSRFAFYRIFINVGSIVARHSWVLSGANILICCSGFRSRVRLLFPSSCTGGYAVQPLVEATLRAPQNYPNPAKVRPPQIIPGTSLAPISQVCGIRSLCPSSI